jgi:exopolysaccharide biosynthesis polyprenyl glycosylphosphotransferase
VTTVETGEVRLELPAPPESLGTNALLAAWELVRRALHDGRLRALAILTASVFIAAAYESSARDAEAAALISFVSWMVATHLTERSLRTVRAVAGRAGVAAFSAVGGSAVASGLSFWLHSGVEGRVEVLSMTAAVFAIVFAAETGKALVSVLRSRVLLVGGGRGARDLVEMLARDERTPFTVVGIVDDDAEASPIGGVARLGSVNSLCMIVEEHKPELVVVAADRGRPEVFARLASVAGLGFRVVGLPEFYEHAFARVPVRNVTDAWFMSVLHLYQRSYTRAAKRTFDLVVASVGLLLTAPLFPLVALLVRHSDGPIFYRQTRLGENGRYFSILKFRTMTVDAERDGAAWAQECDPRTTTVGRVLRRTRLDEIPQLLNVLRGEMSIVGPRPERPEFLEMLEETVPFWSRRHLLKPGITGWAQLRSGYAADAQGTEEKLAYDLWYLRHRSLIVDFMICARTVPSLLLAAGR